MKKLPLLLLVLLLSLPVLAQIPSTLIVKQPKYAAKLKLINPCILQSTIRADFMPFIRHASRPIVGGNIPVIEYTLKYTSVATSDSAYNVSASNTANLPFSIANGIFYSLGSCDALKDEDVSFFSNTGNDGSRQHTISLSPSMGRLTLSNPGTTVGSISFTLRAVGDGVFIGTRTVGTRREQVTLILNKYVFNIGG